MQIIQTETSLLKVKTDILHLISKQNVVCFCMLDLSAAFDTISNSKLLNCLHHRFGITGTALKWIESYLQNRTQSVVLPGEKGGSTKSGKYPLNQGIPQGPVLGPILFNLYVSPLGQLCKSLWSRVPKLSKMIQKLSWLQGEEKCHSWWSQLSRKVSSWC